MYLYVQDTCTPMYDIALEVYEQKKVDFAKKELHKSMSRGRVT